jgi:hypothetical protein
LERNRNGDNGGKGSWQSRLMSNGCKFRLSKVAALTARSNNNTSPTLAVWTWVLERHEIWQKFSEAIERNANRITPEKAITLREQLASRVERPTDLAVAEAQLVSVEYSAMHLKLGLGLIDKPEQRQQAVEEIKRLAQLAAEFKAEVERLSGGPSAHAARQRWR